MSEGKIIGGRKGENRKGTFGGFFAFFERGAVVNSPENVSFSPADVLTR